VERGKQEDLRVASMACCFCAASGRSLADSKREWAVVVGVVDGHRAWIQQRFSM
jgi:hypothetical protein